ncbi:MAG TPA: efflux RND transporter periplasmic adaptor subunit [Candidatus Acidoferrales bacterium]|nr:efflux RND transporter periplasmic adaptor subunit [Candidatus Acidoferrales bacterium]
MDWVFRRRIWIGLLAALLLVAALVKLSGRQPVARVAVVRTGRENLRATISSNGKVEPITPYSMRAEFPTFVEKLAAAEGQAVKRGQLLLSLSAEEIRADLARARERLISAQDDLRAARAGGRADQVAQLDSDLHKATLERERLRREREALERLVSQQAATKAELDQNQIALERAEADWQRFSKTKAEFTRRAQLEVERASLLADQARAEVNALEAKARSARVVAPVDGTLYALPVRTGDYVKVGDLLAEMADLRRVRVRAFIDEPELGALEPNQTVEITWDALPSRTWSGRTEQIPKQVVARGSRSVGEVLCSVDNSKLELLPNTNVDVRIHLRERQNALVVPRGAVYSEGTRRIVYVVENGSLGTSRLQRREIHVGMAGAANYEVLDGLREGEMVALPSDVELREDMRVRVIPME